MVFNNTTDKSGLIQDCEIRLFGADFGHISDNANRMFVFTNLINRALDKITHEIISNDTTWQWDDYNRTDFPEATTDLVSGQRDYPLDKGSLTILEVQVKDREGNWKILKQIDEININTNQSTNPLEERYKVNGDPVYYNPESNSILLYPSPDYAQDDSIKIKTQRPHTYFTTADTTKEPGFMPHFHPVVSMVACADYAVINSMEVAQSFVALAEREMRNLREHLSKRNTYERRMKPRYKITK
jgi:hypothetical protein